MRLWSIHPKYLDTKGLVALWRESLLAQNVLLGKTRGYKNHPQLYRFKSQSSSIIGNYLMYIYKEALDRGYNFNKDKIISHLDKIDAMSVTEGQLIYEINHLKRKLKNRDPKKYKEIEGISMPETHPLFKPTKGGIESWERV